MKATKITSEEISFEGVADAFVKAVKDRASGIAPGVSPAAEEG